MVLFPCARERHPTLEHDLRQAGYRVLAMPLYATELVPDAPLPEGHFDVVVFTSPSAAKAWATRRHAVDPGQAAGCERRVRLMGESPGLFKYVDILL